MKNRRELQRSVRRGAKLLDLKMPGWFGRGHVQITKIQQDRGYFDRSSPDACGCVAAQLAEDGHYLTTTDALGLSRTSLTDEDAVPRHGFSLEYEDYIDEDDPDWEVTYTEVDHEWDKLWRDEIRARR